MRRIAKAGMLVVVAVGALVVVPATESIAKTDTSTTIYSTKQSGGGDTGRPLAQEALGVVGGGNESDRQGEEMTVKYFKQKHGSWHLLDTNHPTLDQYSNFKTRFTPVPAHGTCKITAAYPGDAHSAPSSGKALIKCANGHPAQARA